ncbi:MAG: hypothetical protein MO847_11965 [Candidatus Protistobacter heckmanni]|nr:hypothetical protein [Candidatus Protistobacter heckmanni]
MSAVLLSQVQRLLHLQAVGAAQGGGEREAFSDRAAIGHRAPEDLGHGESLGRILHRALGGRIGEVERFRQRPRGVLAERLTEPDRLHEAQHVGDEVGIGFGKADRLEDLLADCTVIDPALKQ